MMQSIRPWASSRVSAWVYAFVTSPASAPTPCIFDASTVAGGATVAGDLHLSNPSTALRVSEKLTKSDGFVPGTPVAWQNPKEEKGRRQKTKMRRPPVVRRTRIGTVCRSQQEQSENSLLANQVAGDIHLPFRCRCLLLPRGRARPGRDLLP